MSTFMLRYTQSAYRTYSKQTAKKYWSALRTPRIRNCSKEVSVEYQIYVGIAQLTHISKNRVRNFKSIRGKNEVLALDCESMS